jgi:hypothetical protein
MHHGPSHLRHTICGLVYLTDALSELERVIEQCTCTDETITVGAVSTRWKSSFEASTVVVGTGEARRIQRERPSSDTVTAEKKHIDTVAAVTRRAPGARSRSRGAPIEATAAVISPSKRRKIGTATVKISPSPVFSI